MSHEVTHPIQFSIPVKFQRCSFCKRFYGSEALPHPWTICPACMVKEIEKARTDENAWMRHAQAMANEANTYRRQIKQFKAAARARAAVRARARKGGK